MTEIEKFFARGAADDDGAGASTHPRSWKIGGTGRGGYEIRREPLPEGYIGSTMVINLPAEQEAYFEQAIHDAMLKVARQCAYNGYSVPPGTALSRGSELAPLHDTRHSGMRDVMSFSGGNAMPKLFVKALEEAMPEIRRQNYQNLDVRSFAMLFSDYARSRIFSEVYETPTDNLRQHEREFIGLSQAFMPAFIGAEREYWHEGLEQRSYSQMQTMYSRRTGISLMEYMNSAADPFNTAKLYTRDDVVAAQHVLSRFQSFYEKEVDAIIENLHTMVPASRSDGGYAQMPRAGVAGASSRGLPAQQAAPAPLPIAPAANKYDPRGGADEPGIVTAQSVAVRPAAGAAYDPRGTQDEKPFVATHVQRVSSGRGLSDPLAQKESAHSRMFEAKSLDEMLPMLHQFIMQHTDENDTPRAGWWRFDACGAFNVASFDKETLYAMLDRITALRESAAAPGFKASKHFTYTRSDTFVLQEGFKLERFLGFSDDDSAPGMRAGHGILAMRLMAMLESTGEYFVATKNRLDQLIERSGDATITNTTLYAAAKIAAGSGVLFALPAQINQPIMLEDGSPNAGLLVGGARAIAGGGRNF